MVLGGGILLHHVGFGHETEEDMFDAVQLDSEKFRSEPIHLPVYGRDAHDRYFIRVQKRTHPFGGYWIEHQHGRGHRNRDMHLDLYLPYLFNARGLIAIMAQSLGEGTEFHHWDQVSTTPAGAVWAPNENGGKNFGVFLRTEWWDIWS